MLIRKQAIIPDEFIGLRYDVALVKLFPDFSRAQLTRWLKAGDITSNQNILKSKEKVKGGEEIYLTANCQSHKDLPEEIPLEIIYEDEALLIINKQAGLIVHPGAGNKTHTLVNALLFYDPSLKELNRAGIIHRLDKDTTGLLVIAKTLTAHTNLIRQMQNRAIKRNYLALVQGTVPLGGKIQTFYGRDVKNRLKMAVRPSGKEAITSYQIAKRFTNYTLLNVELYTGRTHQIRVHMAYIKHPIVGDPLYNVRRVFCNDNSLDKALVIQSTLKRQLLHAHILSLAHPITKEHLLFKAPPPLDFQLFISACDE